MTLDETLAAIEAEESKATKGPWKRDPYDRPHSQVIAAGNEVIVYHGRHNRQVDSQVVPNHNLIAHSRNILPSLLRLVRRQREEMEIVRKRITVGSGLWQDSLHARKATDLATAELVTAWEEAK